MGVEHDRVRAFGRPEAPASVVDPVPHRRRLRSRSRRCRGNPAGRRANPRERRHRHRRAAQPMPLMPLTATATATAKPSDCSIADTAATVRAGKPPPGRDHDVLGNVLRQVGVAQDAPGDPHHNGVLSPREALEPTARAAVAFAPGAGVPYCRLQAHHPLPHRRYPKFDSGRSTSRAGQPHCQLRPSTNPGASAAISGSAPPQSRRESRTTGISRSVSCW